MSTQVSLSDDSWYRAPHFSPEGNQSRRTDIEALCEIIYAYGERYEDGTAAIGFTWLFKVNHILRASDIIVDTLQSDVQSSKHCWHSHQGKETRTCIL